MNEIDFQQSSGCNVTRKRECSDALPLKGRYKVEHWRANTLLQTFEFDNGITNEGKNAILGIMFDAATQLTTWYLGLIDNSGFTALAAADIYDNINQTGNGWDEFASYTDPGNSNSSTTRPVWNPSAPASQSISNGSPTVFDITGSGTVKGVFACAGTNAATKGDHTAGTAHKLWGTALFNTGDVAVANGDQLKITYTVSA